MEKKILPKATGDDDTEGHLSRSARRATGEGDDDTEGHFMPPSPGLARQLSSAREEEIQRNAKARQHLNAAEGSRPHNKRGRP